MAVTLIEIVNFKSVPNCGSQVRPISIAGVSNEGHDTMYGAVLLAEKIS